MPKYIDLGKQLVRLYRLNLTCEDVIKEFLLSADVVEVVRCKDCRFSKHGDGDEWEEGVDGVCEYWDSDGIYPYDFCSQGKGKES